MIIYLILTLLFVNTDYLSSQGLITCGTQILHNTLKSSFTGFKGPALLPSTRRRNTGQLQLPPRPIGITSRVGDLGRWENRECSFERPGWWWGDGKEQSYPCWELKQCPAKTAAATRSAIAPAIALKAAAGAVLEVPAWVSYGAALALGCALHRDAGDTGAPPNLMRRAGSPLAHNYLQCC